MFPQNFLRQALTHSQARLVHRNAVHQRVGASEVHVFEDAGRVLGAGSALPGHRLFAVAEKPGLARHDVAHQFETKLLQRDALGGNQVFRAVLAFAAADHHRPNAVRIAESQKAVAENQEHHRVGALTTLVYAAHRPEYGLGVHGPARSAQQFVRKHVQQEFAVGICVEIAAIAETHFAGQLAGVGEIAVVGQGDSVGAIDKKRLGLGIPMGACRGITHMPEAGGTLQVLHMASSKGLAHQSPRAARAAYSLVIGHDARRVLAAVLEHDQGVVDVRRRRALPHQADNPAHH